ncbi:MAG: MarR family transcriptional regulator [Hamadaea sp.]|uniref:MarR family winged helix-turn-helix transcriptional regulator n=1 Tax=Hamadaea sp. TaxID=2024425 RepID=UPI00180DEB49|nr:MarR family transcriptional regulator [Hamadaea sp.]NUR70318.1 MarR family transcriptional regulator [Hamadaea sp.]NUT21960.1 MarR family transcriptional regulator [Hamadaea sp.]
MENWPEIDVPDRHPEVLSGWLHIQQAVEIVQAAMTSRMERQAETSLTEHGALFRLATAPNRRMSMLRLADYLNTSPSGVTRLVDRLVRRGWVAREVPPENRRQTDAVLTAAGLEALTTMTRPAYHAALEECFGSLLDGDDLDDLRRIGRKLLEGHNRFDAEKFAASPLNE